MENDNKHVPVSTEGQEEQVLDSASETDSQEEDVVTLSKKELNKLNRKAYAYDALKQSQPIKKTNSEPDDEIVKTVKRLELSDRKRQFGFENGLSPEETDAVFTFAGDKPTKDTLNHPFVKAGIESLRKERSVEANTPSGSRSHSPLFGGKPFEEQTPEERQKAFEERMKNVKR